VKSVNTTQLNNSFKIWQWKSFTETYCIH